MASADDRYGAARTRVEEPGWRLGELVRPGMLIAGGPHHCPYLVEKVTYQAEQYADLPCWGLTGFYAPGGVAERDEHRRWWLNGWVAVRYAAAPLGILIRGLGIYDYECPARDACFIVIADQAFAANRAGQLMMFP